MERILELREFVTGQASDERDIGGIIDSEGGPCRQIVGNPPTTQMLSSAHVGGLRSGRTTHAIVAFEDDALDTAESELDGERKSNRTCTYDQDRGPRLILRPIQSLYSPPRWIISPRKPIRGRATRYCQKLAKARWQKSSTDTELVSIPALKSRWKASSKPAYQSIDRQKIDYWLKLV
jgi:hypothetical protein